MNKLLLSTAILAGAVMFGAQSANADEVKVQTGDTLGKIAQEHNTTVQNLAEINGISNINMIFAGETLFTSAEDVQSTPVTQTQAVTNTVQVEPTYTQEVQTAAPVQEYTAPAASGDANGMRELRKSIENGGSYNWDTGNGYYGAYQFAPSTWQSVAAANGLNPADTSQANQDAMADAYANSRYGGWANTPTSGGW